MTPPYHGKTIIEAWPDRVQINQGFQLNFISCICVNFHLVKEKKKKSASFHVHNMRVYRGSRGVAPFILKLCTRWKRVVNFAPRPFCSQERTLVPTEKFLSCRVMNCEHVISMATTSINFKCHQYFGRPFKQNESKMEVI